MLYEKSNFLLICIFLMLICKFIGALEDHKINLKIGFDLIPRPDGSPSIRIREFEDFNLRKFGRRDDDASSDTEDAKEDDEKDEKESDAEAVQSSDSDDRALRSTRGINPEDFEPEPHANIHNRGKSSDSESEAR